MTCKKCGAQLPPDSSVCSRCGTVNEQPSREAVRARVQGGGRRTAPKSAATAADGEFFPLLGLGLGLLQILLLFVKGAVTAPDMWTAEVVKYSLFKCSPVLGLILLLLCVLGMGCAVLPLLGQELSRGKAAAVLLPLAALLLGIITLIVGVNAYTVKDPFFGSGEIVSKASVGAVGVLFLMLCACSALAASCSAGGKQFLIQRPAASHARGPQRPVTSREVRQRPQEQSPRQQVTPPDAETIAALRKMAQMHREGLISDEEFDRIKAECVARGWIRQ